MWSGNIINIMVTNTASVFSCSILEALAEKDEHSTLVLTIFLSFYFFIVMMVHLAYLDLLLIV